MDEVLEYVTKAASVTVGESTLAAQTIAFVQELTETMATCENACLVVTLPSSLMEHYDQKAEEMYQQLQKVSGRSRRSILLSRNTRSPASSGRGSFPK